MRLGPAELVFLVPIVAILGVVFLAALKIIFRSRANNGSQSLNGEEARIVQEIHQSLLQMEKRIEALETLLMEKGIK